MCKTAKDWLSVIRDYKDIIWMFGGFIAAVFIYTDFRSVVKEQAETAAKTAEILRTMDVRLSNLEHQSNKYRGRE